MESSEKQLPCRNSPSCLSPNGIALLLQIGPFSQIISVFQPFLGAQTAELLKEDEVFAQLLTKGTLIYTLRSFLKHKQ